jgi:hypothetical protein
MRILLPLFVSVLSACAAPSGGVSTDYKLHASGIRGLVVGSITYDTSTGSYGVSWYLRNGSARYDVRVGSSIAPAIGEYDTGLQAKGGVFVAEVFAGTYTLRDWTIVQGRTVYSPKEFIDVPFTVEGGKVTYVGNVHFLSNDSVLLLDRADRDLPVIRARFEAVRSAPLAFSIAPGTKIEQLGGEMDKRFLPSIIFVPVAR